MLWLRPLQPSYHEFKHGSGESDFPPVVTAALDLVVPSSRDSGGGVYIFAWLSAVETVCGTPR
jgi:hypothetical protein